MAEKPHSLQKTILIVDDEPSIGQLLSEYLVNLGYRPEIANDCNDVIIFFDEKTPDIVFLDIQLPVVNGVTILKLIKRIAPEVVVVMMSGIATEDTARETLKIGAFDYITKPFEFSRVTEILRAIELTPEEHRY
ncbi:MAG: response regulator [Candidatus Hatepunaea meridiana]|nr:response regulator [Candidatus Hatepunaea meridiana]